MNNDNIKRINLLCLLLFIILEGILIAISVTKIINLHLSDVFVISMCLISGLIIIFYKLPCFIQRLIFMHKIKKEGKKYFIAKENNIYKIALFMIFSSYLIADIIRTLWDGDIGRSSYLNLFLHPDYFTFACSLALILNICLAIYCLFSIIQDLFCKTIITNEKIICYDGFILNINSIDTIEYALFSEVGVIKIGRGFHIREIIVEIEYFENVKKILGL